MRVTFRTDASVHIGSGHVMRCLTLAQTLKSKGAIASFICRDSPGDLCDFLESSGFPTERLPYVPTPVASPVLPCWEQDAAETMRALDPLGVDWVIVDHYALDIRWEAKIRQQAKRVMAIDDLANRPHDCDLLLDQNFFPDAEQRYIPHVASDCVKLLGPAFALLRAEFEAARTTLRKRDGSAKRVLIFFGGSDSTQETMKVLRAVKSVADSIEVDVLVGNHNLKEKEIMSLAEQLPHARCFSYATNMAELIVQADLFIGTAGISTWERCCLGLPSVIITTADNQVEPIASLAKSGVLLHGGHAGKLTETQLEVVLRSMIGNTGMLKTFSARSMELVDGKGAERCANRIFLRTLQ